jgi:hypothetical protein
VKLRRIGSACLLGLFAVSGCGDVKTDVSKERLKSMAGGQLKDVVAIKGVVSVDGSPAAGINLFLYRLSDTAHPVMECRTDQDGKYCWTTYTSCDGLEPGVYLLGFTHIPKPKRNDTGVDLFKGKYKDPKKNKIELKVEAGVPQEAANYDLVTKS